MRFLRNSHHTGEGFWQERSPCPTALSLWMVHGGGGRPSEGYWVGSAGYFFFSHPPPKRYRGQAPYDPRSLLPALRATSLSGKAYGRAKPAPIEGGNGERVYDRVIHGGGGRPMILSVISPPVTCGDSPLVRGGRTPHPALRATFSSRRRLLVREGLTHGGGEGGPMGATGGRV